jgi:hypothetical protein
MVMTIWLLIMALALGLILPVMVVLVVQKHRQGQADLAGRKRKHEDASYDPVLDWLQEEDDEPPADLADLLAEEKAKRREDE